MLRRKLILTLGPPITLLLISAVVAIWLLGGVLTRFDAVMAAAAARQASAQVDPAVNDAGATGAADSDSIVLERLRAEEAAVVARFRRIVIGLALVFVVVINFSVIALLRLGSLILRPIDKLVEATRSLAAGRYDVRVRLEQHDEFDELGEAYNALAERLQSDERRQLETLGQVALAMNHEINNSISIIELQLRLLSKRAPDGPGPQRCLEQIHQSLQRMTHTVQALKTIRRIVLTDYIPGVKMLDLERSQRPDDDESAGAGRRHESGRSSATPSVSWEKQEHNDAVVR